jgi:DNA-binding Xre family transcriptional regulator
MIVSKLKDLMTEKGMTFQALESATGFSSVTVNRARGPLISKCRLETLEAIAKVLGVRVVDLFTEEE